MIIIHGQKANAVDVNIGLDVPARIDLSVYHTDTLLRSERIIGTLGDDEKARVDVQIWTPF